MFTDINNYSWLNKIVLISQTIGDEDGSKKHTTTTA